MSDHLGSTAVTLSGTTEAGEVRYRAFGASRFTSGLALAADVGGLLLPGLTGGGMLVRAAAHADDVAAGALRAAGHADDVADAARAAAQGGEAVETISSYHLYFSQKGISWSTRSGVPLDDLAQDIAQRWRGEPLRVVELEGKLVSLDNRRLAAAKLIGADVPIRRVSQEDPEIAKLIFQRDGVRSSVLVRGTNLRIDVSGRVFEQ